MGVGSRRGSYATLYALAAVAFIGFGAIAVDISMLRLADAEVQAVADAAAQAAVLELRRTDDRAVASGIATEVVASNQVAGLQPKADQLQFGIFESGVFAVDPDQANAVKVDVDVDIDLPFSGFWGGGSRNLRGTATAAARPLHTVVVVDITNSWDLTDFANARAGVLAVYDQLTAAASNADRIGLVTFHGKWGTEYTPLVLVKDAVANGVRADWEKLNTASMGVSGDPRYHPDMPLQFPDETGTDHAIGLQMATKMFSEVPDPSVYRAMIIVTDGQPWDVGAHQDRFDAGYVETRWRWEFTGATARTVDEIKVDSVAYALNAWNNAEVHTWMVSFKQNDTWMEDVAQGDGYFIRTDNSADMLAIFTDIAESLPVTLVE